MLPGAEALCSSNHTISDASLRASDHLREFHLSPLSPILLSQPRRRSASPAYFSGRGAMNWVQRKIYLYNVTFGLYMLDWWERYLFNTLVLVLMWFIFYNSSRYLTEFCKRHLW
ncbi:hypothetical protein ACLB2K_031050 [Fragaria x ananassa]